MTAMPLSRPSVDERIRAALWFAEQGFGVFSVWSTDPDGTCRCVKGRACENAGKHPVPGIGFKAATTDPMHIRTMLSIPSEPNYGMLPPEGVFALDVDGEGIAALARLEAAHGPLPPTLRTEHRARPAHLPPLAGRAPAADRPALRLRHALGLGARRRLRCRPAQRPRQRRGVRARHRVVHDRRAPGRLGSGSGRGTDDDRPDDDHDHRRLRPAGAGPGRRGALPRDRPVHRAPLRHVAPDGRRDVAARPGRAGAALRRSAHRGAAPRSVRPGGGQDGGAPRRAPARAAGGGRPGDLPAAREPRSGDAVRPRRGRVRRGPHPPRAHRRVGGRGGVGQELRRRRASSRSGSPRPAAPSPGPGRVIQRGRSSCCPRCTPTTTTSARRRSSSRSTSIAAPSTGRTSASTSCGRPAASLP